jgi:signal peptidase II
MNGLRHRCFAIAALVSLTVDQLTKIWARRVLQPLYPHVKTVVAGYWDFRYSENRGAAFGFANDLAGAHLVFAVTALLLAVGSVFYLRKAKLARPALFGTALGLVVGGALGNAIDRLVFGRVTDFVVWKIGRHEWDTFNVADAALVVGIALLLIDSFAKASQTQRPG